MQYPIIQFFQNDRNIYAQSKGPTQASVSLFHTFKDSIILDAGGMKYKVKGLVKISWAYLFGYHPLMKGRLANVKFEFSEQENLTLEEFKKYIIDRLYLGVENGFWYSKDEIPNLIVKISECIDYKSTIECFTNSMD